MVEKWVFLNGEFHPEKYAQIPVTDRGFLFGEGIFTTIRVYHGRCELFAGHLERLRSQADELGFEFAISDFGWIDELIDRNEAHEGIWRLKIVLTADHGNGSFKLGTLLATLHPFQGKTSEPCSLCLYPIPLMSPLAHLKSLSYLDHLTVRRYGELQGYQDAIATTGQGYLLETGCSNLFWIDQEAVWLPDPKLPYLKGVFLQSILPFLPIPIHFVEATIDQVPSSASVYTCNSLTHARPVLSIGQRTFPRNEQGESMLQQAAQRAIGSFRGITVNPL